MKFLLLSILYVSISYSQSNYWEYHSLDNCTQLVKTDNEVFYAASYPALLKSADYGISWDTIYTSNNLCEGSRFTIFVDTNYIPDDRIIVIQSRNGCPTYFNISTDGGNSWNSLTNMPGGSAYLTFTSQGNIYYMGVNINMLYSSSDNGETWNIVNNFPNPPWDGYIDGLVSDIYDNLYTTFGYVWEVQPGIFDGTRVGMQSTNFGFSWQTVFPGVIYNEWVPDMTLITTATGDIFAQTGYGIFYHYDGSFVNSYYLEWGAYSALVNKLGHIYCTGMFTYSTNQGNSWITDTSGLGGENFSRSVVIDLF